MEKELGRLQKLADLDIDFENQNEQLKPYVELAKYITDSPVCEINIIDAYTQWTVARSEDSLKAIPRGKSVCHDTIQQDSTYEIPDLSNNKRYQDRFYVTGEPNFRYYCGVQLTTSDGVNIGSICVLDMKSKQISAEQKKQLENLGQLVVNHIERESRFSRLSDRLDKFRNSLRNLNHDVRSPINGIVGIADILLSNGGDAELPEKDLVMIKDSAEAVIEEIDGVLNTINTGDGSKIDLGGTTLSNVIEKVKRLYTPLAQQKGHSLAVKNSINDELSISHEISMALTKIIGNLVANAIKFTPEGGIITVGFSRKTEKQILDITVEDTGEGMAPAQIQAFNSGQRVERSKGTADEQSFGIGLDHIRQLVKKREGRIVAEGNKKKGTTFTLEIPLPADANSGT